MPQGAVPPPRAAQSPRSNLLGAAAGRLHTTRARLVVGGIVVAAILVTISGLSRGDDGGPVGPGWGGPSDSDGVPVTVGPGGPTGSAATMAPDISNTPILYFATSADTSEYNHDLGVKIPSDAQKIVRFLPEKNFADLVDQNASYSFAPSEIYPYTVDRRLFIRTEVRPSESNGHTDITEYDPRTGRQLRGFGVGKPNSITGGCTAIVGDSYFYMVTTVTDQMDPYHPVTGGEFMKIDLSKQSSSNSTFFVGDGDGTQLLGAGDADGCPGHLAASNGELFDARYWNQDSVQNLMIVKRDLATGRPITAATRSWTVGDAAGFKDDSFAFDHGTAYWARINKSNGQLEISHADLAPSQPTWYAWKIKDSGLGGINWLSVSNGYLAVGEPSGKVYLFDTRSGTGSSIDLKLNIYALQLLYIPA